MCFLILDNIIANKLFPEENENVSEYFTRLIDNMEICFAEENSAEELVKIENERPLILQKDYKTFCEILSEISFILYYLYEDLFFLLHVFSGTVWHIYENY
ncbi:MAG: hypothetical protein LBP85_00495 [Prevotellaceae bacterium]|jgi:hypothetical protein|nr:hypothetical protein [Prevotellaceae bacterium]